MWWWTEKTFKENGNVVEVSKASGLIGLETLYKSIIQ